MKSILLTSKESLECKSDMVRRLNPSRKRHRKLGFEVWSWKPGSVSDEPIEVNPCRSSILTGKQAERIKRLRQNGIFKPADKSRCLHYMSRETFHKMTLKLLNNGNYEEVDVNRTTMAIQQVREIISKHRGKDYQLGGKLKRAKLEGTRERWLYPLPKDHKEPHPDGIMKARPIVDCKLTPLASIDKICADWFKPLYSKMTDIVKTDSIAVLQNLRSLNEKNIEANFIVQLDVEDLYGNTPIEESIDSVIKFAIDNNMGDSGALLTLKELLTVILNNNVFRFADRRYIQRHGIPMGSNMSPLLADVFLYLKEKAIFKPDEWPGLTQLNRYRDDILAICEDEATAKRLVEAYNTMHPRIKVTGEISETNAIFLDLKIGKLPVGKLRLGVYHKPMDTLAPLHWQSQHPRPCLLATIYARAIRTTRICNNATDWWSTFINFLHPSMHQGYRFETILKQWTKAIEFCVKTEWPHVKNKHEKALKAKEYRTTNVLTYSNELRPIYRLLKKRCRFALRVGKPMQARLCRTNDH